jgi:uncharacterized protein (DUF302 family)
MGKNVLRKCPEITPNSPCHIVVWLKLTGNNTAPILGPRMLNSMAALILVPGQEPQSPRSNWLTI